MGIESCEMSDVLSQFYSLPDKGFLIPIYTCLVLPCWQTPVANKLQSALRWTDYATSTLVTSLKGVSSLFFFSFSAIAQYKPH